MIESGDQESIARRSMNYVQTKTTTSWGQVAVRIDITSIALAPVTRSRKSRLWHRRRGHQQANSHLLNRDNRCRGMLFWIHKTGPARQKTAMWNGSTHKAAPREKHSERVSAVCCARKCAVLRSVLRLWKRRIATVTLEMFNNTQTGGFLN